MKRILGLDLGTNSIGWALTQQNFDKKEGKIDGIGSRIIPISQDILGKFDSGQSHSQTSERTGYRGVRRLIQRNLLRRERLHRILNILGFLPQHYAESIDFEKHFGQFKKNTEVKLNYKKNESGKYEFIFMDSFNEMVEVFLKKKQNTKIPLDWTIYYLRKKALSKKISKEELAWIILNFNQKRGYYQLRGEEEETDNNKQEEFYTLKVKDVIPTEDKNNKGIWYNVILENDWIYRRQSKEPLDNWIGTSKEFIITTTISKDGKEKRSFRAPKEDDWNLLKKKTEQSIKNSKKTVGEYIFDTLLANPSQKIKGKLIKTIERKLYKKELSAILKEQKKHHPELQNRDLYKKSIEELYPRNEAHQNNIKEKDFTYLFLNDIIFYQRPLKSKKSTISNCSYETRTYKKKIELIEDEKKIVKEIIVKEPLKAISKSNPLYQEFRLWQFLANLKIYDKTKLDRDVTSDFIKTDEDYVNLFDFLNVRKEVDQKNIIQYFITNKVITKSDKENIRWNYVEDKKYPCNETKANFLSRLSKVKNIDPITFLTPKIEQSLWHIIYSIKDKTEFEQALKTFAKKHNLDIDSFIDNFIKFPPFKNEYGQYSEKAIKKLLPLMRKGKYWNENEVDLEVKERIKNILERLNFIDFDKTKIDENITDDDIPKPLLKSFIEFKNKNALQGLNTYQACYAVYNRHSENNTSSYWKTPMDIEKYLKNFKQHSLRNPIVEQVVTETLRVVKSIWEYYGNSAENFFDEIHVELGREMKNSADKRKRISDRNKENENTNQRIKSILQELKDEGIKNIKPYSTSQQEILKIYEEGVYQSSNETSDEIEKIRKNNAPTKAEITKYRLWLEQGYISPYTGQIIPLSRLFTTDYQIEHIIPQSRFFDNSLSNKIICESEVNQLKDNKTAYEFIKNNSGRIVDLGGGKTVKLFKLEDYENHCSNYFKRNRSKLKKLLSEEIPEDFINRQLNDSRYISKLIKGLLSNIVRQENEQEATSKNLIPVTGAITSKLKNDWGLNDKWNELIAPRFIRLNKMTSTSNFGYWDEKINAFRTQVPDEIAYGFNKKRIDHRHHALDALVVACTHRKHIQYLNTLNSEKKNYSLRDSLLIKNKEGHYTKNFLLPWYNFTSEAKNNLEKIVVSFKQNLRVINKSNNRTWQWVEKDGKLKKQLIQQTKGNNWAIRKPMHTETVYGKVLIKKKRKNPISLNKAIENWELIIDKKIKAIVKEKAKFYKSNLKLLKKYFRDNPIHIHGKKIDKVDIYEIVEATASRVALSEKFTRKQLESITDSGIQLILENHLKNYIDDKGKERFDLAFNSEGLDSLNKNIITLNNGKQHQPIYKVRTYEIGNKFNIGETGNKKDKYVEAAKGTNLFFAIYWDASKQKRVYETIPLIEVIEHQKWRATLPKEEFKKTPLTPIKEEKGQFLFSLSPNDLVYVPTDEEIDNPSLVNFEKLTNNQVNNIYKVVSFTGNRLYAIPNNIASPIQKKYEFTQLNKLEFDLKGKSIKDRCWKLKTNRLGKIIQVLK